MFVDIILILVGLIVAAKVVRAIGSAQRAAHIRKKYGNTEAAQMIIDRRLWHGETSEQLIDSLGEPIEIDSKRLMRKSKEIWKYNRTGRRRYGMRITIENRHVVGWDIKR
jgi:hypothetical protein